LETEARDRCRQFHFRVIDRLTRLTPFALSPIRSGSSIPLAVLIKEQFWKRDAKHSREHVEVAHLKRLNAGQLSTDPRLTPAKAVLPEAFSKVNLTPLTLLQQRQHLPAQQFFCCPLHDTQR
jgi:hypothetical protein